MSEEACLEYRPSKSERFWRALGYNKYRMADLPEEAGAMPGWAVTSVRIRFSFLDRVRLLVSGKLKLDIRQAMDAEVTDVVSATSVIVEDPTA